MIRAVVFDFGGVLMRTEDRSKRQAWEARLNLAAGELEQIVHGSAVWIEAQAGTRSVESYWEAIRERLALTPETLAELQQDYFAGDVLDQTLIALIQRLRAEGLRVGLLSNDATTLEQKLRAQLAIYECFDAVLISAQTGVMKPDPTAYRMIAERLGCSTPECVFIDDNTANVDGARAVGMAAYLYRPGMDVAAAIEPHRTERTKAVIFDYGNVLDIPPDAAVWEAHREALAAPYGLSGKDLGALIHQSEAWEQVKVGAISFESYLETIFHSLGINDPAERERLHDAYFVGREGIHPEMLAIVQALKQRGEVKIGVLSNAWQLEMAPWLERDERLKGLFDDVVSSAAVGMAKPEVAIYHLTVERLGVRPGEAILVDDLRRNTEAAES
ncbi:MAG TPA: HAD family phosphatase, partial [Aggregatilineales bacterium]|nr:HAD family phosphatase [Aggregatilineales bacterium]